MMERISSKMDAGKKAMMTRQMKHGFIYLSPLLFRPVNDFWHLPKDFFQYDQKLEELAFGAGLGVPTLDERREDWMKAIERQVKGRSPGDSAPRDQGDRTSRSRDKREDGRRDQRDSPLAFVLM